MNYGRVKKESLKLINKYSIAGSAISSSYNNQADYLSKIPGLVDAAQLYIATTAKKIVETVLVSTLSKQTYGSSYLISLPDNCWQMSGAGLLLFSTPENPDESGYVRYHGYKQVGSKQFIIAKSFVDANLSTLLVEYFRYPEELGEAPADTAELDGALETHYIIPYYVAAHLLMYDDYSLYVSLNNEFETKLSRLGEIVHTEVWPIEDSYSPMTGGGGFGY